MGIPQFRPWNFSLTIYLKMSYVHRHPKSHQAVTIFPKPATNLMVRMSWHGFHGFSDRSITCYFLYLICPVVSQIH